MVANDNACLLDSTRVLESIASKLAPTTALPALQGFFITASA
jgi:hypothetical protein